MENQLDLIGHGGITNVFFPSSEAYTEQPQINHSGEAQYQQFSLSVTPFFFSFPHFPASVFLSRARFCLVYYYENSHNCGEKMHFPEEGIKYYHLRMQTNVFRRCLPHSALALIFCILNMIFYLLKVPIFDTRNNRNFGSFHVKIFSVSFQRTPFFFSPFLLTS